MLMSLVKPCPDYRAVIGRLCPLFIFSSLLNQCYQTSFPFWLLLSSRDESNSLCLPLSNNVCLLYRSTKQREVFQAGYFRYFFTRNGFLGCCVQRIPMWKVVFSQGNVGDFYIRVVIFFTNNSVQPTPSVIIHVEVDMIFNIKF